MPQVNEQGIAQQGIALFRYTLLAIKISQNTLAASLLNYRRFV
ncbi:hypothetical protein [Pontibacter ramchanderi]|nr:hypothetical protein [Pontibacter ramchanderi]